MRVFLDNAPLDSQPHSGSLADALAAVQSEAGSRLIVEVHADGAPVPADHLTDPPETSPYCDELTCVSADRAAIVRVSLGEAADLLGSMGEQYPKIVEMLQVGQTQEGLPALADVFNVWQQVEQTVQTASRVDGVTFAPAAGDDSTQQLLDTAGGELAGMCRDLKDAVVAGDFTTVADAIEYDLAQLNLDWQRLLNQLAERTRLRDNLAA